MIFSRRPSQPWPQSTLLIKLGAYGGGPLMMEWQSHDDYEAVEKKPTGPGAIHLAPYLGGPKDWSPLYPKGGVPKSWELFFRIPKKTSLMLIVHYDDTKRSRIKIEYLITQANTLEALYFVPI